MSTTRFLGYALSCFLVATSALADPTGDLLGAKHVKDFIRVSAGADTKNKTAIVGATDTFTGTFHFLDGRTFSSDGDIGIFVADFNPLTQVWTIESTSSADPNTSGL